MGRKVVLMKGDVNLTVQFYFEKAECSTKMYWQMMNKDRIREIFEYCLKCPKISSHSENRIFRWIEEEYNTVMTEKQKDKLKSKSDNDII